MDFAAGPGLLGGMDSWWTDLDDAIIGCLPDQGPLGPAEIHRLLGISEEAAASLVSPVVQEGKTRLGLVGAAAEGVTQKSERSAA